MQAIGWTKKLFAKNPMKDARLPHFTLYKLGQ